MTRPLLSLIAAVATNRAIGRNNELLFRISADLQRFKRLTSGHPVIMGRKTWESLPARNRPLPGRLNIVVTRNTGWQAEGAVVAHSLDDALHHAKGAQKAFVIGGAELFIKAMPLADELELTEVDRATEGDVFFPDWKGLGFVETAREHHHTEGADPLAYDFVTYQRQT
jgi:dihydrofolate reductase